MTNYWKDKVVPKFKKLFEKNGKKTQAMEASKVFNESKEEYTKEFEEKKSELQPKVVEIYEASSAEIKTLIKEPKDAGLKKHSAQVQKFLDELVKIEFPGARPVCEACYKVGPAYLSGPVFFVFEKVSTFVVTEEKRKEEAPPVPAEEATTTTASEEKPSGDDVKGKEIVVEGETKPEEEEKEEPAAAEKAEPPAPAASAEAAAQAATTEAPKAEETPAPAAEPAKP